MTIYFQKSHQRAFGTYPLKGDALRAAVATALAACVWVVRGGWFG